MSWERDGDWVKESLEELQRIAREQKARIQELEETVTELERELGLLKDKLDIV